jgi:PhnB protein
MKLSTYLHFDGNCEEALKFYQKALGAKLVMLVRYGETPAAKESSKEMQQKIIHGRIAIGDDFLMACDAPKDRCQALGGFSINIGVDTVEEAARLFQALSEKAEICMPFGETFWAHGFGMLKDQFGVAWMVNCERKA